MKVIVHIGMHKTGSSSIQHTFAQLNDPGYEYIDWGASGNHSALFVLLFEDTDNLLNYHAFKARETEFQRDLLKLRDEWRGKVVKQIAEAKDKTVIFSAEDISSPIFKRATQRMFDFFSEMADEIIVSGYVRSIAGFMPSALQQQLKGGKTPNLSSGGVLPEYRARFEKIDQIFGREQVHLKEFSPEKLFKADVVKDFAHVNRLHQPTEEEIIRTNEALSLEAVALLYVQRSMGLGLVSGFSGVHSANQRFISKLSGIGTRKLAFSERMIAPVIEQQSDDINWMEARLGYPFSDSAAVYEDAIDSLDDLTDIALDQYDAVQHLLGAEAAIDGPATIENLVRALERLRVQDLGLRGDGSGGAPTQESFSRKSFNPVGIRTTQRNNADEDLHLTRKLARILWNNDHRDDAPINPAERKAAFEMVTVDYEKKALDLIKRFKKNNLNLIEYGKE